MRDTGIHPVNAVINYKVLVVFVSYMTCDLESTGTMHVGMFVDVEAGSQSELGGGGG